MKFRIGISGSGVVPQKTYHDFDVLSKAEAKAIDLCDNIVMVSNRASWLVVIAVEVPESRDVSIIHAYRTVATYTFNAVRGEFDQVSERSQFDGWADRRREAGQALIDEVDGMVSAMFR